jgi:pyruvate/2-oxoglutarate dehydrogenase complex dihydrolipoamide acyltransferase (E2) component
LREHGLEASASRREGDRLTVADIERHLAGHRPRPPSTATPSVEALPEVEGQLRDLRSDERGMLATVLWHRDVAAAGYIELEYETAAWEDFAKAFADRHKLLLSPLLALMAWRLVEISREVPALNATVIGERRLEYSAVNLGFTVQAGDTLYLAVIRDAAGLGESGFVNALGDIQRRATAHKLGPLETQGATVGFSSMARWKVSRHVPLLAPNTSLMVAHAYAPDGRAVLGASYDHRVLNGSHVAAALRKLSKPSPADQAKGSPQ